ncbi:hypothetical protein [Streptomyces sp. NPDC006739]|uniref:hypothetical protein n=1 Tax=Streptomyces sp. NPDC006739 TaxID=3364763 RepID=UPI00367CAB65
MIRGTTARAVISFLTAALLALTFFASAGSFASAHTLRQVEAKAQPGITSASKAVRDDADTFREESRPGEPTGAPQTRDRHRASASGWAPDRPLPVRDPAAPRTQVAPGVPRHSTARSPRAHSPAALQVFRC